MVTRPLWEPARFSKRVCVPIRLRYYQEYGVFLPPWALPGLAQPGLPARDGPLRLRRLRPQFAILYNTQTNGPLSTAMVGSAKNIFTTYLKYLRYKVRRYLGVFGLGGGYAFTTANFIVW